MKYCIESVADRIFIVKAWNHLASFGLGILFIKIIIKIRDDVLHIFNNIRYKCAHIECYLKLSDNQS